jgi:hypothetical protein
MAFLSHTRAAAPANTGRVALPAVTPLKPTTQNTR